MKYIDLRLAILLLGQAVSCSTSHALPDAIVATSIEQGWAASTVNTLNAIPRNERIVLDATPPVRQRITVFTDVECPYCRKFHAQVEQYLQAGIEVQYLFYPRAGLQSRPFSEAVSVWCAEDRLATLALALNGSAFPHKSCDSPVARHYEIAVQLGLLGTPAVITEDGKVMYGALPVSTLLERLRTEK